MSTAELAKGRIFGTQRDMGSVHAADMSCQAASDPYLHRCSNNRSDHERDANAQRIALSYSRKSTRHSSCCSTLLCLISLSVCPHIHVPSFVVFIWLRQNANHTHSQINTSQILESEPPARDLHLRRVIG